MVRGLIGSAVLAPFLTLNTSLFAQSSRGRSATQKGGEMKELPKPTVAGKISVEQAIKDRRTIRSFRPKALSAEMFSQLLWSAQGVTEDSGFKRAAPSAGAMYPMDVYASLGKNCVVGFEEGTYHYEPEKHAVWVHAQKDARNQLAVASLSQMWMAQAPLILIITAEYDRIAVKYGQRGVRYAMIEAGHIAQNIFLQAQALDLAAGIVGAFADEEVVDVLKIPTSHAPLLLMPVGYER